MVLPDGVNINETDYSDVTLLIPTLNEAETIKRVINDFQEQGVENILVVDGNSDDRTRSIARNEGAEVITQTGDGKGAAVRQSLEHIETKYFVMVDGDATYRADAFPYIVETLRNGHDEVLGNRFADMHKDAMSRLHKFGNRMINLVFAILTQEYVNDLLTGYRGYRTSIVKSLPLSEDRFGIETELTAQTVMTGYETTTIPISYYPRPNGSEANLDSFSDGFDILRTLLKVRAEH